MDGERDLPAGWVWAQLGEIADTSLGKMLDKKQSTGRNPLPYLRNVNVQWGQINTSDLLEMDIDPEDVDRFTVSRGDLLVCEGGEVGRCAIWGRDEPIAYQKALHRVRTSSALETRFLRYYLEFGAFSGRLKRFTTGSTIKHLPQQRLREVPVPVPPVVEQRRIVEALEERLSRLDAAEVSVRAVLRRVDALLGRVTDVTSGVSVEPDQPAAVFPSDMGSIDGLLPRIPADWRWMRLGEVADVVGGVTKDKKKQSDPDLPEVPYLRVANVQRGHLDLDNVATIRVPPKKAEQLRLQEGDVLMNEGGDRDKLGRGWVWNGQIADAIHQNHVFRARVRHEALAPQLLSWYANGAAKWFEDNGKQSTNLASISLSRIKLLPVPVPPPNEQRAIVERIEEQLVQLRHARVAAERVLRQGGKLRNALLRKAFAGGLVPQEATDAPAAEALARIKAERAAQPKPKRARKATAKPPAQRVADATAPEPTAAPALAVQQEFEL
ncbi:restriction endonuclease subunit S [Streptomyces olivaceus]|uniref:restriction endonuclease subunit S n=1 Tax=Streptomyces sp. VN1 TaxID=1821625 RepID=UPI00226BCC3F|nr:restriction endonuclease subunit S [Streptomyces sp. VN1]